jgi:ubiquitin carboxyl-terminal hydrolase L3
MTKNWLPLESNPDVINSYCEKMGVVMENFAFQDVFSIDQWAIDMISKPVLAVVLLYPLKEASEEYSKDEKLRIDRDGQQVSPSLYYMKQTVGDACGTVATLHAIANARPYVEFKKDSYISKLLETTDSMTPEDIAAHLEEDTDIEELHQTAVEEGQSETPESGTVNTHFVCFSHSEGSLYELDGRKKFPINHGPSSQETLLQDACAAIKLFMERDPDEIRFTIMALAKAPTEED